MGVHKVSSPAGSTQKGLMQLVHNLEAFNWKEIRAPFLSSMKWYGSDLLQDQR